MRSVALKCDTGYGFPSASTERIATGGARGFLRMRVGSMRATPRGVANHRIPPASRTALPIGPSSGNSGKSLTRSKLSALIACFVSRSARSSSRCGIWTMPDGLLSQRPPPRTGMIAETPPKPPGSAFGIAGLLVEWELSDNPLKPLPRHTHSMDRGSVAHRRRALFSLAHYMAGRLQQFLIGFVQLAG
jgi:hypothetical protein